MPNTVNRRWQDWCQFALGLWVIASPWVLAYRGEINPAWNAYIVGAAIALVAAISLSLHKIWIEWIALALGAWLIASPWVLTFSAQQNATLNAVAVGILVGAFAVLAILREKGYGGWPRTGKTA